MLFELQHLSSNDPLSTWKMLAKHCFIKGTNDTMTRNEIRYERLFFLSKLVDFFLLHAVSFWAEWKKRLREERRLSNPHPYHQWFLLTADGQNLQTPGHHPGWSYYWKGKTGETTYVFFKKYRDSCMEAEKDHRKLTLCQTLWGWCR